MLVLAVAMAGFLPRPGASFRGTTAGGGAPVFSVSRGAPRRLGLTIRVGVRRPRFSKPELRGFAAPPVARDGSFGGVSRDAPRVLFPHGAVTWAGGRFVFPGRANGSLVVTARMADPSIGVASCKSRIAWA